VQQITNIVKHALRYLKIKFIAEGGNDKLFIKDQILWKELKEKYDGN